jgi:hypothetical protein
MVMGRAIGCAVFGVTMALAACGSSSKTVPGDDRVCEAGARRCDGLNLLRRDVHRNQLRAQHQVLQGLGDLQVRFEGRRQPAQ